MFTLHIIFGNAYEFEKKYQGILGLQILRIYIFLVFSIVAV